MTSVSVAAMPKEDNRTAECSWSEAIAELWASDWSDPREDVYGPDDGQPEHEPELRQES